jgi:hypothetical protein
MKKGIVHKQLPPQILVYPKLESLFWVMERETGKLIQTTGTLAKAQKMASDLASVANLEYVIVEAKYIVGVYQ